MKKVFENKILVGGICIVVAAILAFLILPSMYKQKEKTIFICRLMSDIPAGTKIETEMLKLVEVGSYGLPETVVKNTDDIVGKYAKVSMTTEDFCFLLADTKVIQAVYASKFADYVSDERLDKAVAEGKRLVAVSVPSNAASVANHLKSGDKVTVAYYDDDNVVIDDILKNIEIYSVENEDAQNLDDIHDSEDKDNSIAASVTLIANDEQAERLVKAEYSGKVHLILENRGVV